MEGSPGNRPPGRTRAGDKGPRIVSNIQLVPPKEGHKSGEEGVEEQKVTATPSNEWIRVTNKNERKNVKKREKGMEQVKEKDSVGKKENPKREIGKQRLGQQGTRRRPPRTAVAIRGLVSGFSYAEALRTLREKISLPELEIEKSHIRKATSGGILIEIPGEDRNKKAEELKNRIAGVLGETAKVTRPTVKREIRVMGLDDSVVPEEVADVLAAKGDCDPREIKVGIIRPMKNGLNMVWAQGPVGAMIKASSEGKIRIGWTIARIDLLKNRPSNATGVGRGDM